MKYQPLRGFRQILRDPFASGMKPGDLELRDRVARRGLGHQGAELRDSCIRCILRLNDDDQ